MKILLGMGPLAIPYALNHISLQFRELSWAIISQMRNTITYFTLSVYTYWAMGLMCQSVVMRSMVVPIAGLTLVRTSTKVREPRAEPALGKPMTPFMTDIAGIITSFGSAPAATTIRTPYRGSEIPPIVLVHSVGSNQR